MPDRTIAPAIRSIEQVWMPEAQQVRLSNDVSLFFINAGEQPVMRLEIVFQAGKWFENKAGLSYFTGKMLTEGTINYSARVIAEAFDELGAFVEVTPGFDRINLVIHLLNKHLPKILPMIKEMISVPLFPAGELENLKQRKKQQLLVDLQKNSYLAARKFARQLFGAEHPYGRSIDINDIEAIEAKDISGYFQKQLKGNYQVIVSGRIEEPHLNQLNEFLGQEPKQPGYTPESPNYHYVPSKLVEEKDHSLQSSIRLGMAFIDRKHPDFLEMLVVNEILGGYFGSRLMRNIREQKGYTYGISSTLTCLKHASLWVVSTDVKKEYRHQTINEIHKEIAVLQNEPVEEEELEIVKNYLSGTFISSIDTPFALADKFKTIHFSELGYDYFKRYFETIRGINSKRMQELSRKYLIADNFTLVMIG